MSLKIINIQEKKMINYKILTLQQNIGDQNIKIHPSIIFNDSDLILCDAGYPEQTEQIELELKKNGFSIQDITKIVITHHDHDHIGSLNELKRLNPKIEVITSKEEAQFCNEEKEFFRLIQAKEYNKTLSGKELEMGLQFENYLKTVKNCKADRIVTDREYIINGLKILSTPGHTEGHISLFLEESKILISGDLLALEDNKLIIPYPKFAHDLADLKDSINRISGLNLDKIICYHGGEISGNITNLLEKL